MAKKYRSEAFAAIHETMEALHDVGAIDKQTMREFDDACLARSFCESFAYPPILSPVGYLVEDNGITAEEGSPQR